MKIRKAKKTDVASIVEMLADDMLGRQREQFEKPLPQCYIEAFARISNDPNQELMVLVEEGQVVGTFQLSFLQYLTYRGGIRAQIEAVRVRKDMRGKGLGEKMFRWAIDRSREKGAHVLQLTTDKQRPGAARFYEGLGFKPSHTGMKMHFEG